MHGGPLGSSISFACSWPNIVHWETENLAIFPLPHPQHLTDHQIFSVLDSHLQNPSHPLYPPSPQIQTPANPCLACCIAPNSSHHLLTDHVFLCSQFFIAFSYLQNQNQAAHLLVKPSTIWPALLLTIPFLKELYNGNVLNQPFLSQDAVSLHTPHVLSNRTGERSVRATSRRLVLRGKILGTELDQMSYFPWMASV